MTDSNLLVCSHPACGFELPADCFPPDTRNTRRGGRASRCYDCESARTRARAEPVKAGSRAACVALLKASGAYFQRDLQQVQTERRAAGVEANKVRSRNKVRAALAATLPARWESWLSKAREGAERRGAASKESMKNIENIAGKINLPVPADLVPFVGNWHKKPKRRGTRKPHPP